MFFVPLRALFLLSIGEGCFAGRLGGFRWVAPAVNGCWSGGCLLSKLIVVWPGRSSYIVMILYYGSPSWCYDHHPLIVGLLVDEETSTMRLLEYFWRGGKGKIVFRSACPSGESCSSSLVLVLVRIGPARTAGPPLFYRAQSTRWWRKMYSGSPEPVHCKLVA